MDGAFKTLVKQLDAAHERQVAKLAVLRSIWTALLTVHLLVVADVLLALGDWTRLALDGLLVVVFLGSGIYCYWSARRASSRERMVARIVEEHYPDIDNALVNAIDFEGELAAKPRETISQDFMRQEIATASERVIALPNHAALRPPSFKRETLTVLGLLVGLLALAVLAPGVFFVVTPRYALPFADFPPYNATKLDVHPQGAEVDYGSNLKVSVDTTGPIPRKVSLVLRGQWGKELAEFPMFDAGKGSYFQTIENVQDDVEYFVRIPRGRSKRYALTVTKLPRIEFATATFTYPPYTRKPDETRVLAGEPLQGYPGTKVELLITSNRPLKGGTLKVYDQELSLSPREDHAAGVSFAISDVGEFVATVIDVDGNVSSEELRGAIELIEDKKPEVAVTAPGMDSFAVPDAEVPIFVEATDDIGISQIDIYRSHNESVDDRRHVYSGDGSEDIVGAVETLQLKDLGVKPGDVIDYFVTATDNRPGAPQSASTESFRLQIVSFEEYRDFAQSQMTATDLKEKYDSYLEAMKEIAEAQKALEAEAEALREKLEEKGALSEEEAARLDELTEAQERLAEAAEQLGEKLAKEADEPALFDVENDYKEALRDFAERLANAGEHMRNAQQHMKDAAAQQSGEGRQGIPSLSEASEEQKDALDQLQENMDEFQEGIQQANENIEKVAAVMADVEQFKYLYTLQKGLERQTRFYREMADPDLNDQIRLKEMSETQAAVKEELTLLKEALREHAKELDILAEAQAAEEAEDQDQFQDESEGSEVQAEEPGAEDAVAPDALPEQPVVEHEPSMGEGPEETM